jgi:hypothetical protein
LLEAAEQTQLEAEAQEAEVHELQLKVFSLEILST